MFKIARSAPAPGSKPRYVVFRHRQQYIYISSKRGYNETRRMSKMQDRKRRKSARAHLHGTPSSRTGKSWPDRSSFWTCGADQGGVSPLSAEMQRDVETGVRFNSAIEGIGILSLHGFESLRCVCAQRSSLIYSISCTRANQSRLVAQAT
jgi:hypothetical protein